ncbi:MAG TPA: hypothetical protein VF748_13365 [Candidatus Acidoferrum sp.]
MHNNGKILIRPGGASSVNKYLERLLVLALTDARHPPLYLANPRIRFSGSVPSMGREEAADSETMISDLPSLKRD